MDWNDPPVFKKLADKTAEDWITFARQQHALGQKLPPELQAIIDEHGPFSGTSLTTEAKLTWQAEELRDDI